MIALSRKELSILIYKGWIKVSTPEIVSDFRQQIGKVHTCRIGLFGREYSLVMYTTRDEKSLVVRLS